MLTSDLLRVRRQGEQLKARYLDKALRKRMAPVAADLAETLGRHLQHPREEIDSALDAVPYDAKDRVVVLGLKKLLLDRCDFELGEGMNPVGVREHIFLAAAKHRRELAPQERFDRDAVVRDAAEALELSEDDLQARLFCDLKGRELLEKFRPLSPDALLDRYDVALAQGVLLRATQLTISLDGEEPKRVRQLFRAARFHGLLHRLERHADGYLIRFDGPLSLFSAVQRYGIKLALFLPAVLKCKHWSLDADVLWGKERRQLRFQLGPDQALKASGPAVSASSPELTRFVEKFRKLGSSWTVTFNDEIVALPGESVCAPDLLFEHAATGEQVFLEVFGFWSRQAVWQRVETIGRGFPSRIILAIGKQLRVSEEVLSEEDDGQIYVYKAQMQPKAVLARLDAPAPARLAT